MAALARVFLTQRLSSRLTSASSSSSSSSIAALSRAATFSTTSAFGAARFPTASPLLSSHIISNNNNNNCVNLNQIRLQLPSARSLAQVITLSDARRELAAIIEDEIENLFEADKTQVERFVEERGVQIEEDKEKDALVLRWSKDEFSIVAIVELSVDEYDPEQEAQHEAEENQDEEEEGMKGEEIDKIANMELIIEKANKDQGPSKMLAECAIGKDKNFYIENFRFKEEGARVWTADLTHIFQERFYEWLESIGVDAKLIEFVLEYNDNYKVTRAKDNLISLKQFVYSSGAGAGAGADAQEVRGGGGAAAAANKKKVGGGSKR